MSAAFPSRQRRFRARQIMDARAQVCQVQAREWDKIEKKLAGLGAMPY